MAIDDYLTLLDSDKEKAYDILNHLLWYLQDNGVVDFHEDKLDELYNTPNYGQIHGNPWSKIKIRLIRCRKQIVNRNH